MLSLTCLIIRSDERDLSEVKKTMLTTDVVICDNKLIKDRSGFFINKLENDFS